MFPNIIAELARHNMSQVDLADKLDVSPSTIQNWLGGRSQIRAKSLLKMSELWNCSIDYLLSNDNAHQNTG